MTTERRRREPVAPDTGCFLHPSCLACPREVCIHDIQRAGVSAKEIDRTLERRSEARRLRDQGLPGRTIAARLGVTVRTVWRLLE
jgi:hypothetical protein